MKHELFWIAGSPYAWRALLGLAVKGVAYESRLIQGSEREHKQDWFLAMNPRGKVPVLKHGDTVVYESLAILAYLDALYPDPPLFGRTPEERAAIFRRYSEVDHYFRAAVSDVTLPVFFGGLDEKAEEVKAAALRVAEELARYESMLEAAPFLAGETISAADLALYPDLRLLGRALLRKEVAALGLPIADLDTRYPATKDWTARIEALPGFEATYPPHWR